MQHPKYTHGTPTLVNSPANRGKRGGPAAHKNPDCPCNACQSRRHRAQETRVVRIGGDPEPPTGPKRPTPKARFRAVSLRNKHLISAWIALRNAEPMITVTDSAERLGVSRRTLYNHIRRAVESGNLTFDDPMEQIEFEIVPKTVQNLSELLDQKDKQATLETAKGTIFRAYQEAKAATPAAATVLALKLEFPKEGDTKEATIALGQVLGQGRLPAQEDEESDALR